jgi:hypothetical protein
MCTVAWQSHSLLSDNSGTIYTQSLLDCVAFDLTAEIHLEEINDAILLSEDIQGMFSSSFIPGCIDVDGKKFLAFILLTSSDITVMAQLPEVQSSSAVVTVSGITPSTAWDEVL